MWYNFLDHIFDHNEHFLITKYPGVAQLVGRLVWDQDAASSSLATRTKSPESACAESGLFCLYGARLEQLNATRTSVAGEGLTEPILYLRLSAQMKASLATRTKTASFQHENWRFCHELNCFHRARLVLCVSNLTALFHQVHL